MVKAQKTPGIWTELNERQQIYLRLIFQMDQETEQYELGAWSRGSRSRPASEWRWLRYGETAYGPTRLKSLILDTGLVDQGTGSTFKALETRNLIQTRSWFNPHARLADVSGCNVEVYLQPLGRKVVRQALGIQLEKKLPTGTLQDYQWSALATCYAAGFWGLKASSLIDSNYQGSGSYGGFSWKTWLRLRDYKWGSLVEEYHRYRFGLAWEIDHNTAGRYGGANGTYIHRWIQESYIRLTSFGEQFYRENWQRYRELYPNIEAAEPCTDPSAPPNPTPNDELAYWMRHRRGDRGLKEIALLVNQTFGCDINRYTMGAVEQGYIPENSVLQALRQWILQNF